MALNLDTLGLSATVSAYLIPEHRRNLVSLRHLWPYLKTIQI